MERRRFIRNVSFSASALLLGNYVLCGCSSEQIIEENGASLSTNELESIIQNANFGNDAYYKKCNSIVVYNSYEIIKKPSNDFGLNIEYDLEVDVYGVMKEFPNYDLTKLKSSAQKNENHIVIPNPNANNLISFYKLNNVIHFPINSIYENGLIVLERRYNLPRLISKKELENKEILKY
jgi:hypothetical protein